VNTFRHELVHVRTNSTLDVPAYSNRTRYPTWFHEGTATYLSADPRSGLSKGYQEYQGMFFYLAQRHGIRRLQEFYSAVFGGQDVQTALDTVYSISGTDQLVALSGRWHRGKEAAKTVIWVAALVIVFGALRGRDRPYIGALQLLIAAAVMLAAITGLAEHLYGLRGPTVVLVAKLAMAGAAVCLGYFGTRRINRYRSR
jgi:lysylphosphatidylglycerol synthetase-like protein (DUF2156 family)